MSHYTNKQKEHRNRKEKRKSNAVEAQAETEHGMMVPMHGGAPLVVESGVGQPPECTG